MDEKPAEIVFVYDIAGSKFCTFKEDKIWKLMKKEPKSDMHVIFLPRRKNSNLCPGAAACVSFLFTPYQTQMFDFFIGSKSIASRRDLIKWL